MPMASLSATYVPIRRGGALEARPSWLGRHFWAAAGLILVTGAYLHSRVLLNNDVSWFLWSARALLHGEQPGIDILDPNLPLAMLVYVPAVWLGSLGLSYPVALALWLHLIMGSTAALARCAAPDHDRAVLLGLALATWGIGWDFGQRDEVVWLLCWPYVLAAGSRADGRNISPVIRATSSLLVAFAICLKPFYLLLPVTLQLWLAWRAGSWRQLRSADNIMASAFCAAMLAAVWFLAPDYVRALPVVSAAYWLEHDVTWTLLFGIPIGFLTLVAAVLHRRAKGCSMATAHILAAVTALAAFAVQRKGFSYQIVPATLWLVIALSLLVRDGVVVRGGVVAPAMRVVGLTGLMLVYFWRLGTFDGFLDTWPLPRFVHEHSQGGPVYIFGPVMSASFPLVVYADAEWTGRFGYPMVALAAMALAHQRTSASDDASAATAERLAAYARQTLDEDFVKRPPRLVLIQQTAIGSPVRGAELLAFQLEDAQFREIWRRYRPIASIAGYDAFELAR